MDETGAMELIHWGCQADAGQVNRMGEVLSGLIASARQMDVLTGYFYFNGVPELAEALEKKSADGKSFTLRILVGMEAQKGTRTFAREILECEPLPNLTVEQRKALYAKNLLDILRSTPGSEKTNSDARLYKRFVEMLSGGALTLEIKQTKQPNHGKLYLFHPEDSAQPKAYVLGSSNFSKQGLKQRHELNLRVGQDPTRAEKLADLFQDLWEQGSHEIIEVSKKKGSPEETPEKTPVGVTPDVLANVSPYARPTPFEAYMALMKHYLGNSVLADDVKRSFENAIEAAGYNKVQYQLKGAAQAIGIIEKHGGVIIADAVGLGKSVTAALIATQAHPGGGVIIVPPTLVDEWKAEYLKKFKLNAPGRPWAIFSMTELAVAQTFCNQNAIGMVVVDEAHRFRNPKHRDYPALKQLCNGRRIVLLTATPFNNGPSDLAALVDFFEARAEKVSGTVSTSVYDHIIEQDKLYKDLVFLQRNWNRHNCPPTVEKMCKNLKKKHSNFNSTLSQLFSNSHLTNE